MDDIARRSKRGAMKSFSTVKGNVHITLDMSRFKRQFQRAQYQLDGAVMESMVPFMPMITGSFINTTRAASAAVQGSGVVYAAYGPQGRFLYEGKGMVDEQTGSPWARRGAKKVLVSQYGQRNGWNIRSRRIRKRKRSGLKQPRRQMKRHGFTW